MLLNSALPVFQLVFQKILQTQISHLDQMYPSGHPVLRN